MKPNPTSNILISLGTAPLLVAIVASRAIADTLQHWGQASEELFRGDRLPILHSPPSSDPQSQDE